MIQECRPRTGARVSLASRVGLGLLWVYRCCVSPFTPRSCRFEPTCSAYAERAIRRHGFVRGVWLAGRRLLRCHPLYRGPLVDPVPEPSNRRRPTPRTGAGSHSG